MCMCFYSLFQALSFIQRTHTLSVSHTENTHSLCKIHRTHALCQSQNTHSLCQIHRTLTLHQSQNTHSVRYTEHTLSLSVTHTLFVSHTERTHSSETHNVRPLLVFPLQPAGEACRDRESEENPSSPSPWRLCYAPTCVTAHRDGLGS